MLARVRPGPLLQTALLAGALGLSSCGPGLMPPSLRHPLAGAQAPRMADLAGQPTEVGIWHGAPVKVTVVDFDIVGQEVPRPE